MHLILDPELLKDYAPRRRVWQGIPSVERTAGGRLFFTWYSGGTCEEVGNFVLLATSEDDGLTVSDPIAVLAPEEGCRCFDPELWIDPHGRLWWTASESPSTRVFAAVCDTPDGDLRFSEPRPIGEGIMMNKPIVTEEGWLFPMAKWGQNVATGSVSVGRAGNLAHCVRTEDEGRTFQVLGGVDMPRRSFDEHQLVERRDGSLWMTVRTEYGIGEAFSKDGGVTWSEGRESGIFGPSSRFVLRRLSSGNLLLVYHNDPTRRTNLTATISRDDGATWEGGLLLDARPWVSYPDVTEANGEITVIYDRERGGFKSSLAEAQGDAREILLARFTEEDILCGALQSPAGFLQRVISRLGDYEGPDLYKTEK
jgi:hypothetical protein